MFFHASQIVAMMDENLSIIYDGDYRQLAAKWYNKIPHTWFHTASKSPRNPDIA
jgi:hypothetical protein